MNSKASQLLKPSGKRVKICALRVPKARQFALYLRSLGCSGYAWFTAAFQQANPPAETVAFVVTPERPQRLTHPIKREEAIAVTFNPEDDTQPEVVSLRPDFPEAPHLNLRASPVPKSLCLYDQPYEDVRLTWNPAEFLDRIHFWLSKTASGSLHGADQPLEPLIAANGLRLILPADFDTLAPSQNPKPFCLFRVETAGGQITLRAAWQPEGQRTDSVAAVFWCPPMQHGVIKQEPANLQQLQILGSDAGLDIVDELRKTLRAWFLDKPAKDILQAKVVLVLVLPKTRHAGGKVESFETRAFLTRGVTVGELGRRLGLFDQHGPATGMLLGKGSISDRELQAVEICILQVVNALSPVRAAALNGVKPCPMRIVAVGMGALGSQVYNNLVRAGYGRWTLIDNDVLLPHNCARHFLGDWAVGTNKAQTMAQAGQLTLNDSGAAQYIPADVLRPGEHKDSLTKALQEAELILDLSASIAVSRHLAKCRTSGRVFSAFLTPNGEGLVVAAEDKARKTPLDWLEMLHYRQILNEPALADSLQPADGRVRYGNSCRDVSAELGQDDTAMWAAIASKSIKQLQRSDSAALRIYRADERGITSLVSPQVTRPETLRLGDWTIQLDSWLREKLARLRESRLPNETGGVLLGAFDTYYQMCWVIDALPSPPDSFEWPTCYIRGCEGLRAKIEDARRLTLGQVSYVGEWHSHPPGVATRPSAEDLRAYRWVCERMQPEALPGLMMIVGNSAEIGIVCQEDLTRNRKSI